MITFNNYLIEKLKTDDDDIDTTSYLKHTGQQSDNYYIGNYDSIHDHPDIRSDNLSRDDQGTIHGYTLDSQYLNDFLHKKYFKKATFGGDHINEFNVRRLSSLFSAENTNRKPIITFSGIPTNIGKKLLNSQKGSKHTLPRFTSTTTNYHTGLSYAVKHSGEYAPDKKSNSLHVIKFHNEPGSILSVAKYSEYPRENEMVLNHGAHITYLHSEKNNEYVPELRKSKTVYIHHVISHNTSTPLEKYGKTK